MRITFTSALIIFSIALSAQPWKSATIVTEDNFYSAQKQFHDFWKNKHVSIKEEENAVDGGYQQFARWENFMKTRAYPSGRIPNPDILYNEYVRTKAQRQGSQRTMGQGVNSTLAANWTFVGPPVVPSGGGGAGRINCIAFHPANQNIIYVGAAAGGLWKTTDGGMTWSSSTDQLASISIADIAIDPVNPSNIYVATGDGYGYEYGGWFWGGTYTAGVMKSTDGGTTWAQSGLTYSQANTDIIQRLIINPQNPAILLACTRNGIFQTTDSAANWTLVQSGHYYDMEFNAHNPNIVYAVDSGNVYRSTNGGASFVSYSNNLNSGGGRISIAVTPADTNYMYAFTQNTNFYQSTDGGKTFVLQTAPNGTFYGYYDCVLSVSPLDADRVLTGGTNVFKTDDGGATWATNANTGGGDYVHADNHALAFFPNSNASYLSGDDGGLFKTTNSGVAWTDLSNGLEIKQYYRISSSEINPDLFYGGAQDNGTDRLDSIWTQVMGADGMDCMTDYNDENTAYVSYQYGNFSVTTDGGQTFTNITPAGGDWTTPIVQDPVSPNTIYIGCLNLYKSPDKGTTWDTINTPFQNNIEKLAIAPSNPAYIYALNISEIYVTANGGMTWNNISAGLPVASVALTGVAVSSNNPLKVWVTFSDYASGDKVYKSVNGGATWTNVSGTLPNIPVDCIVYQRNTDDQLYIGTDFGVYYRDSSLTDWVPYQTGLPNVIVDDLKINYSASKLRAGTYGRGMWESDLNTSTLYQTDAGVRSITMPSYTCADTINASVVIQNYGLDTLFSLNLNYKIDNGTVHTQAWSGILVPAQTATVTLNNIVVTGGQHTFYSYTSNPNSATDINPYNDQKQFSFEIDNTIIPYPVREGFDPDSILPVANWRISGASTLFSIMPYGGFGASAHSLMANFYSIQTGTGDFTSERVNLTNAVSPVHLDFNVAYARYSTTALDSLCISVSTNCGATWTKVYGKTGTVLATAPDTSGRFYPTATQWRAETVNLSPWIGNPEVIVQFEAITDYGNNLFIDDINLHDGVNGIFEPLNAGNINVFPVPFNNTLYIDAGDELLSSLQLTDITGKLISVQSNLNSQQYTLATTNLSDGIYFLKIITAKGAFVKKVVRQQ